MDLYESLRTDAPAEAFAIAVPLSGPAPVKFSRYFAIITGT